jgi:hypothetical protein
VFKIAAFLVGVVAVVAVIAVNSAGSPEARPPAQPRPEVTAPEAAVEFVPASVRLNFRTGQMEIRGRLTHRSGGTAPDRVLGVGVLH